MIVNLASKEYSRAVEPWLQPGDRFITCVFGEETADKNGCPAVKVKATKAKMARGSMVRYLAEIGARGEEEIRDSAGTGTASGRSCPGRMSWCLRKIFV